jgi:hypothetical protein
LEPAKHDDTKLLSKDKHGAHTHTHTHTHLPFQRIHIFLQLHFIRFHLTLLPTRETHHTHDNTQEEAEEAKITRAERAGISQSAVNIAVGLRERARARKRKDVE